MAEGKPQWVMTVQVIHSPQFGHEVVLQTVTRNPMHDLDVRIGSWRGIGVPEEVYKGVMASVNSILSDYLVYRYGLQPQLDCFSGGEQEPF